MVVQQPHLRWTPHCPCLMRPLHYHKPVAMHQLRSLLHLSRPDQPCLILIPPSPTGSPYRAIILTLYSAAGTVITAGLHREQMNWSTFRLFAYSVIEHAVFSWCILAIIMVNSIILVLQTESATAMAGGATHFITLDWHVLVGYYFTAVDNAFLGIYVFEAVLKIYVLRSAYFKSPWNVFGTLVIQLHFSWKRNGSNNF